MTEIIDYQDKLEELHRSAVESKDVRSFFTHLYSYTEKIVKTHVLYAAAVGVYAKSYLSDNPNSELGDLFKSRKFIEADIIIPILAKAQRDFRTRTKPHYSWLFLYNFYLIVVSVSSSQGTNAKAQNTFENIKEQFGIDLRIELANIFDNNSTQDNTILTRDIYELQLNIFHSSIIEFLTKNKIELIPPNASSLKANDVSQVKAGKNRIIGKAHLRLKGRSLYVELPDNRSEVLCTYREGQVPLSLMEYIDKIYRGAPDTEFSLTDFAEKVDDFMYDTMANALRACGFDRQVKQLFFVHAPKGKIKFSPTQPINEIELQYILNCAKKNKEKRKSTGSQK